MKGISLWQPWASLVISGAKSVETRCWDTRYRGPLFVHASKMQSRGALKLCKDDPFRSALVKAGFETIGDLPFGALLGTVELIRCIRTDDVWFEPLTETDAERKSVLERMGAEPLIVGHVERAFGDYTSGRFAWLLRDPRAFTEPVPYKGARLLFDVTGVCRVCGCTDSDCRHCIEKTGIPCRWVAENLCSACSPVEAVTP